MRRRPGFTITEMLVSVALIMFIMAILSEAFVAGLTTFRDLKAVGDMDMKLRAAAAILRRDLQAYHVSDGSGLAKVSALGTTQPTRGFFSVRQAGMSWCEGPDGDGVLSSRAPETLSPPLGAGPTNNILHFTNDLSKSTDLNARTHRREHFYSANLNPADPLTNPPPLGTGQLALRSAYSPTPPLTAPFNYLSQFAEIAYFVRTPPTGTDTTSGNVASATPMTLYNLYRRQLVILNDTDATAYGGTHTKAYADAAGALTSNWGAFYYDLCCRPSTANPMLLTFPSMTDVVPFNWNPTIPVMRSLNYPVSGTNGDTATPFLNQYPRFPDRGEDPGLTGADLLLTDVVSFNVRIMMSTQSLAIPNDTPFKFDFYDIADTRPPPPYPQYDPRITFDTGYDNSSGGTPPETTIGPMTGHTLRAVEITLRVWDRKTLKTRQITIIQDL